MSNEKNFLENDFVFYKNEKIVICKDGRIFSIDKDTELVDLRDCENCKQKDQCIAELEKYNAQLEYWKSKWYNSYDEIRNKYNKSNKTAVKEFADEFKKLCFNYGEFDDILCYRKNACELIDRLLKERGIE